ncbi:MAG: hypothetical protein U9N55_09975 [candidate division Zixibacteria bacterium]|nr:hypothetical protein [candidate division Zixibacteria bacterium]
MHSDYQLSSRHQLKACYQRNMMIGMLGAIVIFVLPVCYFSWQSAPESTSPLTFQNIYVQDHTMMTSASPTKRNVGGRMQSMLGFHGQFGIKLRIIPDGQVTPIPKAPSPKVYAQELAPILTDPNISISDMDEGVTGSYVPEDAAYSFEYNADTPAELTNRPCTVLTKVDPEYPRVAEEAGKEGQVVLILPIDAVGFKSVFPDDLSRDFEKRGYRVQTLEYEVAGVVKREFNVVVAKEEPADWFFASNLLKVISQWAFTPWIEDGKPVSAFLTISYNYCLAQNCLRYEFKRKENVSNSTCF